MKIIQTVSMKNRLKHYFAQFIAVVLLNAAPSAIAEPPSPIILDGWDPVPLPTSQPKDYASATSGSGSFGSTHALVVNPDPNGTGIVYSTYADDPNIGDGALANLAANLGHDPIKIYEWVRNNVRMEFYFGSHRGAYLTWLERAGNDIDQCALLGALFKAAGYTPTYRKEYLTIPRTASGSNQVGAYEWLGVTDDASVLSVLQSFRPSVNGSSSFQLAYMWVSVNLPGRGEVRFVPGIAPHSAGRKPDLASLSGYSLGNAFSEAEASTTGASSSAINTTRLRDYLTGLAAQASSSIRSSSTLHDLDGAELAQKPVIIPEVVSITAPNAASYPQGLSFPDNSETLALTGVPVTYEAHLKLTMGTVSRWFSTSELRGQTLAVEFDGDGVAIMRLDGAEIETESAAGPSASIGVSITYEVPIAFQNGSSTQLSGSVNVLRNSAVAVAYGMGRQVGRLQKILDDVSRKEAGSLSNVTLTDRLQIVLQQYLAQSTELFSLANNSLGHDQSRLFYGAFGFLKNNRVTVSIPVGAGTFASRRESSAPSTISVNSATTLLLGALEGTAIEQLTGPGAFGTPTLFNYAMTQGRGFRLVSAVSELSGLANFDDPTLGTGVVASIEAALNAGDGTKVVLLNDSALTFNGTSLAGYYRVRASGLVSSFNSGSKGGADTKALGTPSVVPSEAAKPKSGTDSAQTVPVEESSDPVDLSNGAFLKDDTDLVLGQGSEPTGLRIDRHYNSARRFSDPVGLGRGFTHNYALRLTTRSPNDFDSLRCGIDEALPVLLAVRLAQEALAAESSARAWQVATTAIAWAVDQQLNSRASISLGTRSVEFVRNPNGTYSAPANLTATLVKLGNGDHDLAFRHGNTIRFRATDGKFTSIKDQHNNTLNAVYNGSNQLSTVTDAYNRVLTFAYSGSQLTGVTDSTGRSVGYNRTGNAFTFTDAEGKSSIIEIDGDERITKIFDADGRTIVENDYDAWGRVYQQRALGETTKQSKIWITGGVGTEVDPLGHKVWTYFDARGRKIFMVNEDNRLAKWSYDGADRLVKAVTFKGIVTEFDYDEHHVLTSEKSMSQLRLVRKFTPAPSRRIRSTDRG